ncbi:kelch-like protein 24 [Ictalurus punctatus]|uniref:Kelch-like protein 24 n=1 Tax=Ictalurus punctatus TaxID=7998 RepID=A0A2D0SR00_ICTPU|nr:kelch-like protein 24 [Ictalurus punctatus]
MTGSELRLGYKISARSPSMGFGVDVNLEASLSTSSYQPENILHSLNVFRKNGTFTDVVLQVEEQEFPCHRAVLCASSRYFRTMFMGQLRESSQSVVPLNGVSEVALEHLLNFMYEGRVQLQEENVELVFQAADLLDVPALSRACVDVLEKCMSHLNCLGMMEFAKHYSLQPLLEQCQNLLYQDFDIVVKQDEFLELPLERVVELLDSEKIQVQEEVLVEAALLWVHHQGSQRKAALAKLLERLRLPLLDPVFFTNMLEADELVQDSYDCRKLLQEARLYRTYGREINSERTKPRRQCGWAEVIVVIGGCDKNRITRFSSTEKLDPTTGKWLTVANVPGYKHEFAVCELHNDIYFSGGQLNSSQVWRFMAQLNQWVSVGKLLKGRWRHKMASLCGKLYAVGGYDGHQRLSSVECFSVFENMWKPVAPLLLPVSSAALASCSGKLYVISGAVTEDCNTNMVQCYDPVKDQWTQLLSCPFSQRCLNAVSLNGSIYVAGGLLNVLYCYSPKVDSWSKVADLPMKLENCGLTVCDGKVYILGGRDEFEAVTDRTWAFDPLSGQLTEEMPLTHSLSHHGCVTITQHLQHK